MNRPTDRPFGADYATARLAFTVIAAMTLARIWFLGRSGLELYGDEAQAGVCLICAPDRLLRSYGFCCRVFHSPA